MQAAVEADLERVASQLSDEDTVALHVQTEEFSEAVRASLIMIMIMLSVGGHA